MSLFTKKQTTEKATTPIQEELYLVTKAVDTNSLPKEVLNTDFELLTKAEEKGIIALILLNQLEIHKSPETSFCFY